VVAPIASGSLFTKVARGFEEFIEAGLLTARSRRCAAPRPRAAHPSPRRSRRHRRLPPVKPDTIAKSLAIGNPADGPYAVELANATGGVIESVNDDEIRAGVGCWPRRPASSPRRPAASRPRYWPKLAAGRAIDPDERVGRLHHRRRSEDARRRAATRSRSRRSRLRSTSSSSAFAAVA
jgi:threonine synthase